MTALQDAKPTKFTEVPPGSKIRLIDASDPLNPIEAIALDVLPEWGPSRIPAINYLPTGAQEPSMVLATGRWTVEVLTSSASLADLAKQVKGAVSGRTIPVEFHAIQFHGTLESARDCVLFASGKAAVRVDHNTTPISLTVGGVNPAVLQPGDWLVLEQHEVPGPNDKVQTVIAVNAVQPNDFTTRYEVDA